MVFRRSPYLRTTGDEPPERPEDEAAVQPIRRRRAGASMAPDVPTSSVSAASLRGSPTGSRIKDGDGQRRVQDTRGVFRREVEE